MKKWFKFVKHARITPFNISSGRQQIIKKKLNDSFQEIPFQNHKKDLLITLVVGVFGLLILATALIILLYGAKQNEWLKTNKHGKTISIVGFSLSGLSLLIIIRSWFNHWQKNLRLMFKTLNMKWLLNVTKLVNGKQKDVTMTDFSTTAKQPCLFWKPIIPFYDETFNILSFLKQVWFRRPNISRKTKKQINLTQIKINPNLWCVFMPQLNGTYKNDLPFTFGSVLEVRIVSDGRNSYIVHTIYHCINFKLPYNTNMTTSIKPEHKWDLIAKKKAEKFGLESTQFEDKFKMEYNNPIELRKLLQPRIMAAILDQSAEIDSRPSFQIENDNMSICFAKSLDSFRKKGAFKLLLKLNKKRFIRDNYKKLLDSITLMREGIRWMDIFM